MPELPEVETTLRGISQHIEQQKFEAVIVRQWQLRWPIPRKLSRVLPGLILESLSRRAKYLLLKTSAGTIILHLGMSGHLRIVTKEVPLKKHDHVDFVFTNGKILRLNDPRRFGACLFIETDPLQHALLKNLGVEPLTPEYSADYLARLAQKRSVPIKSFIMDNKIVTGIGNIYATESLFTAGIHPMKPAKEVTVQQLQALVKASKAILRAAIKRGGTTLKDFSNSDGKPGYFTNELRVYGRAGQPCMMCDTLLLSMQIGQRTTVFCPHCQT